MPVAVPSLIEIDDAGRPVVAGTRFKVRMIAEDHVANGLSAREIHENYDGLSLAQVHGALCYYFEHKAEIDAAIDESNSYVQAAYQESLKAESPGRKKLRALGLLP